MEKTKTIKKYQYNGFGFPIVLFDIPAKLIRGKYEPFLNYNRLGEEVLHILCMKETPLTGYQVRFIRHYFEFPLRDYAAIFGVTHQAVMKWEARGDKFANISPSIEKMVRLDALYRLGVSPKEFFKHFEEMQDLAQTLQKSEAKKENPLQIDIAG